jgi:tetratricopeptide (TPR) repeat protein
MEQRLTATLSSQLGTEPCMIEDTEEMFCLRESDDCQSKVALGNALAAQYRFKEAIIAYQQALAIRNDDWTIHQRLAGSYLTIRRFEDSMAHYRQCLGLGAEEKAVAFPIGVWHYLRCDYPAAADWFKKVLPCGSELAIAVIYWHTLCSYRMGKTPDLLTDFKEDMDVGHHTAYLQAVRVFHGDLNWHEALSQIKQDTSPLNRVIAQYGLCGYLNHIREETEAAHCMAEVLSWDTCWPCISYLAAWGDQL